ncbi:MAG: GNAT family N-acetyltransferase [Pseudomonadota bacterium]
MADLLNQIILAGGTTAIEDVVSPDELRQWMARSQGRSAWHVAARNGQIMGFQWIEPNPVLPPEAVDIASFVRMGATGLGIGRGLFIATQNAAKGLGYGWINASIRSDNVSGLAYYSAMGFQDWKSDPTVTLSDGTVTGKTYKRFEL